MQVNHAIQLTPDGKTIFTSTVEKVYSVPYDSATAKTTGPATTWVTGMTAYDHSTRTLLLSKKVPGVLLVSRGSAANIDNQALIKDSGHSNIRAFNVTSFDKVRKYTEGTLIGWGLRNSVGMDEDPITGGIWSNENGADSMKRKGQDIHENSPGEEVNFHGWLNGTKYVGQEANYGYPNCAASWSVATLSDNKNLQVGKQFYLDPDADALASFTGASKVETDETCEKNFIPPRITLPSHWAPIDLRFNSKGTVAYMTSRGSW
jgi:glucose/arabinose dehydrogenase